MTSQAPIAIDFASNWEVRGGVWRYGIELSRAITELLGQERVLIPVFDRLSAPLFAELRTTGATVRSLTVASRYDRLEGMSRQRGRLVPWDILLPLAYRPWMRERLFHAALGPAKTYHALFGSRGRPRGGVTVGTIHDLIPLLHYGDSSSNREWMSRLIDSHKRWDTLTIVPSSATRDDLVQHAGFDPDTLRVVHHGIDHARFHAEAPIHQGTLDRHGLAAGSYCLFVSALARHKNVERMVEAYLLAVGDRHDIPLILAGPADRIPPRLQAILEDGTGRVRHVGYLSDDELPTMYRGALAMIHVAVAEGFGFTPLEAMACGCPVVVSHGGASAEVIGDAGVQVDPLQAEAIAKGIASVVEDATLRARLRAAGLARVGQFTWERCARETLAVYEEAQTRERGARRR